MARARNIKPAFFTNELLGTEDPMVSLTFLGLWCLADKVGILEDRPLRIKAELFPYRDSLDVNGYLTVLARLGFIVRYENEGRRFIQVVNFRKHQSPHNTEKGKGFPFSTDPKSLILGLNGYGTVKYTLLNDGLTVPERPDSLIPDTGFTDSLIPDLPQNDCSTGEEKTPRSKSITVTGLVALGVDQQHATDWLKARKVALTQTAWAAIEREAGKAGITTAMAVQVSAENSWRGFRADWYQNLRGNHGSHQQGNQRIDNSAVGRVKRAIAEGQARETGPEPLRHFESQDGGDLRPPMDGEFWRED